MSCQAYGLTGQGSRPKIALLLRNGGKYNGSQLLRAGKLAEALQRINETGLPTGVNNGAGFYHLSFWAEPYRSANGVEPNGVGAQPRWAVPSPTETANMVGLLPISN
jgi:hypothetical protein